MTELANIDSQRISTLVCDFMICRRCHTVDRERTRREVNSVCPVCNRPAGHASLYFPPNIRILADLVQQAFHSGVPLASSFCPQPSEVGVILFFCTLREALLNHFLTEFLLAQDVTPATIKERFEDNRLASHKLHRLFPTVVGKSWNDAVALALEHDKTTDYRKISQLMRRTAMLRNKFLHEGSGWEINRDVASSCVNGLDPLFGLFVALHNIFTCRQLRERGK